MFHVPYGSVPYSIIGVPIQLAQHIIKTLATSDKRAEETFQSIRVFGFTEGKYLPNRCFGKKCQFSFQISDNSHISF